MATPAPAKAESGPVRTGGGQPGLVVPPTQAAFALSVEADRHKGYPISGTDFPTRIAVGEENRQILTSISRTPKSCQAIVASAVAVL